MTRRQLDYSYLPLLSDTGLRLVVPPDKRSENDFVKTACAEWDEDSSTRLE